MIRARFEDAQFFYQGDLKTKLIDVRPKLKGTIFQKELGNLLDKTERVEKIIKPLSDLTGLGDALMTAQLAAHLCKSDLATSTVTEMTALAGVMGKHFALAEGLDPEVAEAIFESVLPRNAGDQLPETKAGVLVSIADKLDSLVGLFACQCGPTANTDPYGLRRAALGLIQILIHSNTPLNLKEAVSNVASAQPVKVTEDIEVEVLEFIMKRMEQLLVDGGVPVEAVRASLSERGMNPSAAAVTAKDIGRQMEDGEAGRLHQVMVAMARPVRLTRGKDISPNWAVNPELFEIEEERSLYSAYQAVSRSTSASSSIDEFVAEAEKLIMPLESYFEKVFVMCDDEAVKQSRLALMRDIASLPKGIINLSELPGF